MGLRARSLAVCLGLLLLLVSSTAKADLTVGYRLSSWLRKRERQASVVGEKPRLAGKAQQMGAKLLHAGRQLTLKVRRLGRQRPAVKDGIWAGSSASLASVEFAHEGLGAATKAASRGSRLMRNGLKGLGVGAAGVLAAVGVHDMITARDGIQRFDAGSDIAWGTQGLLAGSGRLAGTLTQGIGLVGAACQTAAGCKRIIKGLREHDRSMVKLGALDVTGGLAWGAWETIGFPNPYLLAGYAAIMVGREVYDNRAAIATFGKRAAQKVSCAYGKCRAQVARGAGFLRGLAAGLDPQPAIPGS